MKYYRLLSIITILAILVASYSVYKLFFEKQPTVESNRRDSPENGVIK